MAPDLKSRVEELVEQAVALGNGPTKVMLLEEAVRLADSHGDVRLAFRTRETLIEAANFAGFPERALVAFTWCLSQSDRDPAAFPDRSLLWKYKWAIAALPRFPQITRPQIGETLDDLTRRLERAGVGLHSAYKLRWSVAMSMGDADEAAAYHRLWEMAPRDWNSDCAACERDELVRYCAFAGRDEEAITQASPILGGSMRCMVVPQATLARILAPLVRLGRVAEAMPHHLKGYRMIARNREFLHEAAEHLEFLVVTDNLAKGLKVVEQNLGWALETFNLSHRFAFAAASRLLFERLGEHRRRPIKLILPRAFPAFREDGAYDVAGLASWFEADAADLAGRFDARNGNDSFTRRIARTLELKERVTPYPLRAPGTPDRPAS